MKKYTAIVLAGGNIEQEKAGFGFVSRALVEIHKRPMLDWMIDSLKSSPYIKDIIVMGPQELESLYSMRYVKTLIPGTFDAKQSIALAAFFQKTIGQSKNNDSFLVMRCDMPLLRTDDLNDMLKAFETSGSEFYVPCVELEDIDKTKRSLARYTFKLGKTQYVECGVYCIKSFNGLVANAKFLWELLLTQPQSGRVMSLFKVSSTDRDLIQLSTRLSKTYSVNFLIGSISAQSLALVTNNEYKLEIAKDILKNPWVNAGKKLALIFNPKSGRGRQFPVFIKRILGFPVRKETYGTKSAYVAKIASYLGSYGLDVTIIPTERAGHATELAKGCVEDGYNVVVACGGDGTINEVVNGIANTKVALGIIAMGTANVFALENNIPAEIKAACQLIALGNSKEIDLGKCNDRYFICMAGVGFDAQIIKEVESGLKKIFGALAYIMAGIKMLFTYRFRQVMVKIDDQPLPRRGYYAIICNGKRYAGNIIMAPHADMSDGYLDLCLARQKNILSIFNFLFGFNRGKIDKHFAIDYFQCKRIELMRKGRHPIHLDAELYSKVPATITVEHKALNFIV